VEVVWLTDWNDDEEEGEDKDEVAYLTIEPEDCRRPCLESIHDTQSKAEKGN
jgi:hypothetical protein